MASSARPRLLIQYLEPSPAVDRIPPSLAAQRLVHALERLPVTDLALGWRLRPEVWEAVLAVVPAAITVWRWVPVFVDSGEARPVDRLVAVGPGGEPPPPFRELADFRFLCLDHDEVVEAGLERSIGLAREMDADGVLLDRIRWHSPSQDPGTELTCFCDHSRRAAATDGLDLVRVGADVTAAAATIHGRRAIVSALLGQRPRAPLAEFLRWRSATVTRAVDRLASGLGAVGLRAALDVFTPALAGSVGQDLATLGPLGEWSKSMTYFEAMGPAAMPYEVSGYVSWLRAAGDRMPASSVSEVMGFQPPRVAASGVQLETLSQEATALVAAVGARRAVVGIDAVQIPGICEVDDDDLAARLRSLRDAGLGASPCWELLLMDDDRVVRISRAWAGEREARM